MHDFLTSIYVFLFKTYQYMYCQSAQPFAQIGRNSLSLCLCASGGGAGNPQPIGKQAAWTYSRYMGNVWISGVQSFPQVANACAFFGKETFCIAHQQAGSLYFGSLARRHPSTT
jgi:hypothetical protein